MKLIALLASLLVSSAALAGDASANLSWTNATTYTDGKPMPISDIAGVRVMYAKCADGKTLPATVTAVPLNKTGSTVPSAYIVTGLDNSTGYCFAVSTLSVTNGESGPSAIVSTVSDPHAPPAPPTGLAVANKTVYMEVRGQDRFALVAVGTVPPGTKCDTSQSINGYFVVPNKAVSWSGDVRPTVVVAQCS